MPFNPGVPITPHFSGGGGQSKAMMAILTRYDEERKRQAELADGLRATAVGYGLATKEEANTLGLSELRQLVGTYEAKTAAETAARQKQAQEMALEMARIERNTLKAAGYSRGRFEEWWAQNPNATRRDVLAAGLNSGYARVAPGEFKSKMDMWFPNEFEIEAVGSAKPIEGLPGHVGVVTDKSRIQVVEQPETSPTLNRMTVGGRPSGYVQTGRGNIMPDLTMARPGSQDQDIARAMQAQLTKARYTLSELVRMKGEGNDEVVVDAATGAVLKDTLGAWGQNTEEAIAQYTAKVKQLEAQVGNAESGSAQQAVQDLSSNPAVKTIMEKYKAGELNFQEAFRQIQNLQR